MLVLSSLASEATFVKEPTLSSGISPSHNLTYGIHGILGYEVQKSICSMAGTGCH